MGDLVVNSNENIQNCIFNFRGMQVMIDRDLALLYQTTTKRLNEQVKRNPERFPHPFRFQLTHMETMELVANCDRLKRLKYSSVNPYAFSEQGVAMLSSVLQSETAIQVSIKIMNVFVVTRRFVGENAELNNRLNKLEQKQFETENKFDRVFKLLDGNTHRPNQGIFFEGQIFDSFKFISDLIRSAHESIIIIDNYIDDTILELLAKKKKDVKVEIFTKTKFRQAGLDIKKFNEQYPTLSIVRFDKAHDRFLIIDRSTVYHIGASLKDLGKKWFAFSKMDLDSLTILEHLNL